jgi:hypothetical protein
MVWRGGGALLGVPVMLLLAACGTPEPAPTPKTPAELCADLGVAVHEYYDVASPGATIRELVSAELPLVHEFAFPKPSCSFEVRPDPSVLPGDRFTIESFYLEYDEQLTEVIKERLEDSGYKRKDPAIMNWTVTRLGTYFSASMLIFLEGDGQAYTDAADGRVLDLRISQG